MMISGFPCGSHIIALKKDNGIKNAALATDYLQAKVSYNWSYSVESAETWLKSTITGV